MKIQNLFQKRNRSSLITNITIVDCNNIIKYRQRKHIEQNRIFKLVYLFFIIFRLWIV